MTMLKKSTTSITAKKPSFKMLSNSVSVCRGSFISAVISFGFMQAWLIINKFKLNQTSSCSNYSFFLFAAFFIASPI